MGLRKLVLATGAFGIGQIGLAQSPTYGLGRAPTAQEIRNWDIAIGPDGKELPTGQGTAAEGAGALCRKACVGCHGETGSGGPAPTLIRSNGKTKSDNTCLRPCVDDSNVMAFHSPVRYDALGLHQPRHATHQAGHTETQ